MDARIQTASDQEELKHLNNNRS